MSLFILWFVIYAVLIAFFPFVLASANNMKEFIAKSLMDFELNVGILKLFG